MFEVVTVIKNFYTPLKAEIHKSKLYKKFLSYLTDSIANFHYEYLELCSTEK